MRDAKKLFFGLLVFEIFLVIAYLVIKFNFSYKLFFDLDGEGNLPTWFSSIQLLFVGQIFLLKSVQSDINQSVSRFFHVFVCVFFVFLSMDETAQFHETLNRNISFIKLLPRFKGDNGIWIYVYGLIALIIANIFLKDIVGMWRTYTKPFLLMTLGILIVLFGGVILEIVGYQFLHSGRTPVLAIIEVACEEFCEMFGVSIVLYGALAMLAMD